MGCNRAWGEQSPVAWLLPAIQGLEVEVQKLIAKQRTELAAAREQAAADTAKAAEGLRAQHEMELKRQCERMLQVCAFWGRQARGL